MPTLAWDNQFHDKKKKKRKVAAIKKKKKKEKKGQRAHAWFDYVASGWSTIMAKEEKTKKKKKLMAGCGSKEH